MRPSAIILVSVLGAAACATMVPIDQSEIAAVSDGGLSDGAVFGGFGNGNVGFPSREFGGFPPAAGGFPLVATGGRPNLPSATGGRPAAPMQNSGGRTMTPVAPTGGASMMPMGGRSGTNTGGSTPGGSTGAGGGDCRSTEKLCGGVCVSPAPRTGCGLTGCEPCSTTAPANGVVICNANHQCDVSCLSGYTKNGNSCDAPPPSTGGATGGTGGPATSCGGQSCPSCTVILGPSCCTSAGKCGCPLIPWTGGILGCL